MVTYHKVKSNSALCKLVRHLNLYSLSMYHIGFGTTNVSSSTNEVRLSQMTPTIILNTYCIDLAFFRFLTIYISPRKRILMLLFTFLHPYFFTTWNWNSIIFNLILKVNLIKSDAESITWNLFKSQWDQPYHGTV